MPKGINGFGEGDFLELDDEMQRALNLVTPPAGVVHVAEAHDGSHLLIMGGLTEEECRAAYEAVSQLRTATAAQNAPSTDRVQ